MTYTIKQLPSGSFTIVDSYGAEAVAKPVAHSIALKLVERWNTAPEARLRPPVKVEWSDAQNVLLMTAMEKYGFVIPAKRQADWRAKNEKGGLPSVGIASATLVATDGIVAYFVLGDDVSLFYGHLAAFVPLQRLRSGREEGEGRKTSAKPRGSSVQKAIDLLNSFLSENK